MATDTSDATAAADRLRTFIRAELREPRRSQAVAEVIAAGEALVTLEKAAGVIRHEQGDLYDD